MNAAKTKDPGPPTSAICYLAFAILADWQPTETYGNLWKSCFADRLSEIILP